MPEIFGALAYQPRAAPSGEASVYCTVLWMVLAAFVWNQKGLR